MCKLMFSSWWPFKKLIYPKLQEFHFYKVRRSFWHIGHHLTLKIWPPGGQTWSEWLQNVFGPWWPNLATRCKIFTYPLEPSEPITFSPKLAKKICKQPVNRSNLCKQLFCPWWPNLALLSNFLLTF